MCTSLFRALARSSCSGSTPSAVVNQPLVLLLLCVSSVWLRLVASRARHWQTCRKGAARTLKQNNSGWIGASHCQLTSLACCAAGKCSCEGVLKACSSATNRHHYVAEQHQFAAAMREQHPWIKGSAQRLSPAITEAQNRFSSYVSTRGALQKCRACCHMCCVVCKIHSKQTGTLVIVHHTAVLDAQLYSLSVCSCLCATSHSAVEPCPSASRALIAEMQPEVPDGV